MARPGVKLSMLRKFPLRGLARFSLGVRACVQTASASIVEHWSSARAPPLSHAASGTRAQGLEASAAIARLGLTATAPESGSEAAVRLEALVGRVVFHMSYGDLVGKHLAPVTIVRIPVRLESDERAEYDERMRVFLEMRRTFMRLYPGADVVTLLRGLGRTPDGRRALRDRARALELASFPRAKRSTSRPSLHDIDRTEPSSSRRSLKTPT